MKKLHSRERMFDALPLWKEQLIRFLFVGGVNTAVNYALYAAFVLLGIRPELALLVATICSVIFNYFSLGIFVFAHGQERKMHKKRIPRFIAAYVIVYLVNVVCLRYLIASGLGELLAQAVLIPLVAAVSFFLNKLIVFSTK